MPGNVCYFFPFSLPLFTLSSPILISVLSIHAAHSRLHSYACQPPFEISPRIISCLRRLFIRLATRHSPLLRILSPLNKNDGKKEELLVGYYGVSFFAYLFFTCIH